MSEQNNKNLINFIATTVEGMRDRIDRIDNQMATKEDLAVLKEQMVTKRELAALKDLVATKADISRVEGNLAALKEQMATKNDVARVEASLDTKTTAIRGDIGQVQVRLDSIDRAQTARVGLIDTEISRLRSVIYLLVKDEPDMLRLLGQPNPGENRPQG